jgi:helicase
VGWKLDILADKVLYSLEQPTEQCHLLAECIRKGCAFHHAGLVQKQKDLVEKGFKERFLKIICATPTLAAGVNLPAFRVVVRDLKRFSALQVAIISYFGVNRCLVGLEGRLEEFGGSILWHNQMKGEIFDVYLWQVKMSIQVLWPHLRSHVLAL